MAYFVTSSHEDRDCVAFEFVDGDVKKIRIVNVRELHEACVRSRDGMPVALEPFKTGYPIEESAHIPTRIRVKSTMEQYPCCWFYEDFRWIVCSEFKKLVEELEPDTHQFFPVTVLSPEGEVIDERFLFAVCNRLDAVFYSESSGLREVRDKDNGALNMYSRDYSAKVVVRKNAIERYHLWWDKYFPSGFMISDQLANEMQIRNLHGMRLFEAEEK